MQIARTQKKLWAEHRGGPGFEPTNRCLEKGCSAHPIRKHCGPVAASLRENEAAGCVDANETTEAATVQLSEARWTRINCIVLWSFAQIEDLFECISFAVIYNWFIDL